MMAFDHHHHHHHHHHRKFLISEAIHKSSRKIATETDCYLCYVCPENCYISPPPPPPQLSPPPPPPPLFSHKYHIPTVLILMLCVLGVAFLVLSYLTLARYRCRNSRSRNNPEPLETSRSNFLDGPVLVDHPIWYIRTVGLPQSVIDSIASFAYKKGGDGLVDGDDCSVCLSGFEENERLRLLPKCSHAFHLECIDMWLRSHKSCPVCRAPVVVESSPSSSSGSGSNEVVERDDDDDQSSRQRMAVVEVSGDDDRVRLELDRDLQGVRRSVSMDFSMIKNSRCSLQMKRSFSFSYKFC